MEGITNCAVFPARRTSCSIRPVVLPFDFLSQTQSTLTLMSTLCPYTVDRKVVSVLFFCGPYIQRPYLQCFYSTCLYAFGLYRIYLLMYMSKFLYQEKYPYFVRVWGLHWVGWRGSRFESMRGMCRAVATTVCLMS